MIKFSCPHCDRSLRVMDELAGKKCDCPKCGKLVSVPELEAADPSYGVREEAEIKCPFCNVRQAATNTECAACSESLLTGKPPSRKNNDADISDAPPRRRAREERDDSDVEEEVIRKKRKRRRKTEDDEEQDNQRRVNILRGAFALALLFFFALEAVVLVYVIGGVAVQPNKGAPPPPGQTGFALAMYVIGVIGFLVLQSPRFGSWAGQIIDVSSMNPVVFWGMFLCCPGPGLLTPVILSLLVISAGASLMLEE